MPNPPPSLLLAAVALVESVCIAVLVARWRRSRRSRELLAQQLAGVCQRTGALVHELNQPLTAILSNAQAAQRFLAAEIVDRRELREILEDIVMDDKRAAEIAQRMGSILKESEGANACACKEEDAA